MSDEGASEAIRELQQSLGYTSSRLREAKDAVSDLGLLVDQYRSRLNDKDEEIRKLRTQLHDAHTRLAEHIAEHGTPGHIDVGDYIKERLTGRVGKVTDNTRTGAFLFVTWVGDSEEDTEAFSPSELELLPKHEEFDARIRSAIANARVGIDRELLRELVLGEKPQPDDPEVVWDPFVGGFAPGTYVTGRTPTTGYSIAGVVSAKRNTLPGTLLVNRKDGSRMDGEKFLLDPSTVRRLFPCDGAEPPSDVTVVRETGAAITPFLVRHPNGGWEWARNTDDPPLLDSGDPWSETVFNALSKTLVEHLPHDPA